MGSTERRLSVYLLQRLSKLFQSSFFDSMVVHDTSHKPFHFLTQLNCTEARHRTPVETLFNNTVFADSCTFQFHRLPSHRGN